MAKKRQPVTLILQRPKRLAIGAVVGSVLAVAGVTTILMSRAETGQVEASTLEGHTVLTDSGGKIIPWSSPAGDAYAHVVDLDWDYLFNKVPNDPKTGKPSYLSRSYLNPDTQQVVDWPHNPAGLNAMLIESAMESYAFSGDPKLITFARTLADNHIAHGVTSASDSWASVPYASGEAGSTSYGGSSHGNNDGAGDGVGYIQPDKIGELGYNVLRLYEQTGNATYRDAAIHWGDVLAAKVRTGSASQSPWPYRVKASDGSIREQYTADVINPIMLLDELIRLKLGNTASYQTARTTAWNWMMQYPMQNNVWTQYFEDVRVMSDYKTNINQLTPMMTARYLMQHPEMDPQWETHVRGLITWVEQNFVKVQFGANTIKEQEDFALPMGSHTSRYASINAMLYEKTGDAAAKEKAYRALNWATYMQRGNGVTADGPEVNPGTQGNQWFTDGYGDYIRHFMVSMGAVPEWAPPSQNHLLRSTSAVPSVTYSAQAINYTTFDTVSSEVFHLTSVPVSVSVGGVALPQGAAAGQPGWSYANGTLKITHNTGTALTVSFTGTPTPPTPPTPTPGTGKKGDLNGDNKVNLTDLSILLSHWGQSGATAATGDLNGDAKVNLTDLSTLLSNWGK